MQSNVLKCVYELGIQMLTSTQHFGSQVLSSVQYFTLQALRRAFQVLSCLVRTSCRMKTAYNRSLRAIFHIAKEMKIGDPQKVIDRVKIEFHRS